MAVRRGVRRTESPKVEERGIRSKKSVAERFFPIVLLALVVMAFGLGSLWSKIKYLESGRSAAAVPAAQTGQSQAAQPTRTQVSMEMIRSLFDKDLIKFGNKDSRLLLVEVADPSCPYCHIASGKNPELNRQGGAQFMLVADGGTYVAPVEEMRKLVEADKAAYVYIYSSGHRNGEMAQKALYCAYEQGEFWEVHDRLYTNAGYELINNEVQNDKANSGKLADFLAAVISAGQMKNCLESGKYDDRIASDQQLAYGLGVQGTPAFFINTTSFAGAYGWDQMKGAAEAALN